MSKTAGIMKNTFMLILFICSISYLNGQTFAPIGTKWGYNYDRGLFWGSQYIESIGDTLINGKQCRKLAWVEINVICSSCNSTTTQGTMYIYEKNDSLYFVYNNILTLVFTYNFQVGDTLKLPFKKNCVITRKTDTLFSGQVLKKWEFRSVCRDTFAQRQYIFMEKIGNLDCILGGVNPCSGDYDYAELCSFSSGNIRMNGVCNFRVNTSETPIDVPISILPNPAFNYLKIETNHPFENIKIYNTSGKLYLNTVYTEHRLLDITSLQRGIYIIQMTDKNGFFAYKKFIKQE